MMAILHFHEAVVHHHEWLARLVACLTGEQCDLHVHEIVHDDKCLIGQWLHGEGQTFANLPAFQDVRKLHKEVHDIAAQAWEAKLADDQDMVQHLLQQISEIKHQMFMSWNELNATIGSYE